MSKLSRRGFISALWRQNKTRSTAAPLATDATKPTVSREGRSWQQQQGTKAAPGQELPPVISWLSEYMSTPAPSPVLPTSQATIPLLRPPGAIEEQEFLARCTRCNDCANACPHQAIAPASAQFRQAAGTPRIDPNQQPCWLCDRMPCIEACQESALVPEADRMGQAQINLLDCLNALGTPCTVCVEQCPVEWAIDFVKQKPRVDVGFCVGCGVCHYVCPAPNNAVRILPNAARNSSNPPQKGDQSVA